MGCLSAVYGVVLDGRVHKHGGLALSLVDDAGCRLVDAKSSGAAMSLTIAFRGGAGGDSRQLVGDLLVARSRIASSRWL